VPEEQHGATQQLRVLILSANVGEGHASASRALARRLERSPGVCVEIADGLQGMGRVAHRAIERGFDFQLRAAPWMYSLTYGLLMRCAPVRWFAQRLLYAFGARPLTRMIAEHRPDVVISTYPATTVVLGRLRLRRVIPGPVYAAITDLTGLFFWAHPGIDMHFAVYAESAETVERIAGPDSVVHVAPLVDEAFFSPCTRLDAREQIGRASCRERV
jgi:Monogalactosyldiacylglycerol (MGDG) synthase.